MPQKSQKGKKQYGMYEAEGRRSTNRAARIKRHLKNHPNDTVAVKAVRGDPQFRQKPKIRIFASEKAKFMSRIKRFAGFPIFFREIVGLEPMYGKPRFGQPDTPVSES